MRETRLSGSEGGATLTQSSLPLSIIQSLRDCRTLYLHRHARELTEPDCNAPPDISPSTTSRRLSPFDARLT